jgi:hypothetical protein
MPWLLERLLTFDAAPKILKDSGDLDPDDDAEEGEPPC